MRALLQRVTRASVTVADREIAAIGSGLLIFLGIREPDTTSDAQMLAAKIATLRIFEDENGKMNLDLFAVKGQILVVSQFTLYADWRKGRRPAFTAAAPPEKALALYQDFCARLRALGLTVAQGEFGAHMRVNLENDGPVTLLLQSEEE